MGKTVILEDDVHSNIKKLIANKELPTTIQDFANDACKEKLKRDK